MFKIEKDVPTPLGRGKRTELKETIEKMNVGDSFVFPVNMRNNFHQSLSQYVRRTAPDKKFTCRQEIDKQNIRCWRIK